MSEQALSYQIAAAPRDITPRVSRRAWLESRVRFWWLSALVVLGVCVIFGISQTMQWLRDRKLITQGVAALANIDEANGSPLSRKFIREEPVKVKLSFTLQDGTKHIVDGELKPPGPPVTAGTSLPIHYDPANPDRWTERTETEPWAREVMGVWLLLPLAAITFAIALLRRRDVLSIWQTAPALEAVVVDSRHSSIAPRSRVLRYSLREGDRRVCQTLYPTDAGVPQPGESIWLLAPPDAPQRGIVAKLYT